MRARPPRSLTHAPPLDSPLAFLSPPLHSLVDCRSLWDTGDLFGSWLLFLVGAASNLAPVVAVTSTTPRFEW